jgi:hypothetical protein
MATVIQLKDKKVETLFGTRDFEYLIDRYMGFDAVKYFQELIREQDEALEEKDDEIRTLNGTVQNLIEQIKSLGGEPNAEDSV